MPGEEFTIGICATDDLECITRLLDIISNERTEGGLAITDVVAVVSGSRDGTDTLVRSSVGRSITTAIIEEKRNGKALAVNRIIEIMQGKHLILVNGDALPEPGAIGKMMLAVADGEYGAVCALPLPAETMAGRLSSAVADFLWALHNKTMEIFQEEGRKMHLTDELICIRKELVRPIPPDTINDGAYIATRAQQSGWKVSFCRDARVRISVPQRIGDYLSQRRRILLGHLQIKDTTGDSPATAEFSFRRSPLLVIRVMCRHLAERPERVLVLPLILALEAIAAAGALADRKSGKQGMAMWKRVKNAAWR